MWFGDRSQVQVHFRARPPDHLVIIWYHKCWQSPGTATESVHVPNSDKDRGKYRVGGEANKHHGQKEENKETNYSTGNSVPFIRFFQKYLQLSCFKMYIKKIHTKL